MPDELDPLAMQGEIRASAGYQAHENIEALVRSLRVFAGNSLELTAHLEAFEKDQRVSVSVFAEGDDNAYALQYESELARRIHNFVSSVKSLIEHSRQIIRRMYEESNPLRLEYEGRGAAFAADPEARLVQQLREYVLHYELAPTVGTLSFGRADNDMSNPLTMSKATWTLAPEVLLGWKRWDPIVTAYLEAEPDINLLKLVTDYVDKVTAFYTWLHNAQVAEHRADIDATNARIDELHQLFPLPES